MRVPLLNGLHLRLDFLHLPHGDNALVTQREDDDVHQYREDDDRPAPVTREPVDPGERPVQRHDEPRQPAEVDGSDQRRVHLLQDIELFRTDEERQVDGVSRRPQAERHEVARGAVGRQWRQWHVAVRNLRLLPACQGRRDKVVIVDAGEPDLPAVRWTRGHVRRGRPGHAFVLDALHAHEAAEDDPPRAFAVDHAGARRLHAAQGRSPLDQRGQTRVPLERAGAEPDDIAERGRLELVLLADAKTGRILELERESLRAVSQRDARRAWPIQGLGRTPGQLRVLEPQRERRQLASRQFPRHEVDGQARFLVEMILQLPLEGRRAAVPKDRPQAFAFDDDIARLRIAHRGRDFVAGSALLRSLGFRRSGYVPSRRGGIASDGRGWRRRRRRAGSGRIRGRARWRDEETLVHEKHQQRQEEGEQDSSFH